MSAGGPGGGAAGGGARSSPPARLTSAGGSPAGRTFAVLLASFTLFGISIGAKGVLWADLMAALRLGEATFGSAQLLPPLLGVGLMLLGGPLYRAAGSRRLTVAGFGLAAAALGGLAAARGLGGFVAALIADGASLGLLETSVNGAALDWERATGRAVMNALHAGFSGGAVVGALGAGALRELGWTYDAVLGGLALLAGLTTVVMLLAAFPPGAAGADGGGRPTAVLRLVLSRRHLALLALAGALGVAGESVANTWAVVYLRSLGAPLLVGGSAFALFNAAMLAGRLANAGVVARFGARVSLLASGLAMVASALLLLSDQVPIAVGSFVLLGLGAAGVLPTVLAAAAAAAPGESGAVAGGVLAAAYVGFVVCPPVVGWVAELASLRTALVAVALPGLALGTLGWQHGGARRPAVARRG